MAAVSSKSRAQLIKVRTSSFGQLDSTDARVSCICTSGGDGVTNNGRSYECPEKKGGEKEEEKEKEKEKYVIRSINSIQHEDSIFIFTIIYLVDAATLIDAVAVDCTHVINSLSMAPYVAGGVLDIASLSPC